MKKTFFSMLMAGLIVLFGCGSQEEPANTKLRSNK